MPGTDPAGLEPAQLVEASEATVLIRCRSPGFETRPPEFTNGALIPAAVRLACSAWEQRRFEPRDVTVRVLRDVYVAAEGLVFERDGALLRCSLREHEPDLVEQAAEAVRRVVAGAPVERHQLPLVLGKKRGASNYGHWMVEMLPMLHLALLRLADPRIGVLVHDVGDPGMVRIMIESLRRVGVADTRVRVSDMAPVQVRELIMVEGLTAHGSYMSPLVEACHDRLAHGVAGRGTERVFLRRGSGLNRQFQDDAHMCRLASERGYAVVTPGDLSLVEQIAVMRDARLVAGIMGSAMTNLIFARAGARAAVFAPAAMPDTFFWFIASLRGLHYREIRCLQSGAGDDWNRPLEIGFRAFRRVLDEEVGAA